MKNYQFVEIAGKDISFGYPVGVKMGHTVALTKSMANGIREVLTAKGGNINLFVMGSSGAIIGALVAAELVDWGFQVWVVHFKKEGENSHCNTPRYSENEDTFNIIVDDLIASGETVNRIYKLASNLWWDSSKPFFLDALCVTGGFNPFNVKFDVGTLISNRGTY